MIKRRSFLTYFSIGWLASCFPVVLAACAPKKSSNTNTTTDPSIAGIKDTANPAMNDRNTVKTDTKTAEGFTVIGSVADLDKAGYLQTTTVAVARDPANSKQLLAVNPKCTHQGCDVKWVVGEKRYECPCHDSDFAADGKVLKGPASTSLATYPAKIVGTQVLVKI